jgi:hypothetical protein
LPSSLKPTLRTTARPSARWSIQRLLIGASLLLFGWAFGIGLGVAAVAECRAEVVRASHDEKLPVAARIAPCLASLQERIDDPMRGGRRTLGVSLERVRAPGEDEEEEQDPVGSVALARVFPVPDGVGKDVESGAGVGPAAGSCSPSRARAPPSRG